MVTRKRIIIVALLYAATAIHGYYTIPKKFQDQVEIEFEAQIKGYQQAKLQAEEELAEFRAQDDRESVNFQEQMILERFGDGEYPPHFSPAGPSHSINWLFPILPCVLIAEDGYSFGPLWGEGHISIYIDFFVVIYRIPLFQTWIS